ncbi:hypothetical protein ES703_65271 [subsurface metagenome]
MANLQQPIGLLCSLHHSFGPLQRIGHLLFAIDVQTSLQTSDSVLSVPKVRRGDYDSVEVLFRIEHFLVVHVSIVLVAICLQYA